MTGPETVKVINMLERELPSRRNDVLSDDERKERMAIWAVALSDFDFDASLPLLSKFIASHQWFPRLSEIIEALGCSGPDPLDVAAAQDAECRAMFPDWVNDGLSRGQRNKRMEQAKLAEANLRIAE